MTENKYDDDEKKIINNMKKDYSYPDQSDINFQYKLYKKREFYYNKIPNRKILTEYEDIKKFRDKACGGSFQLRSQQYLLSNFINPATSFKGLLIYHGTGTGKCVHPSTIVDIYNDYNDIYITRKKILDIWDTMYEKNNVTYKDNENGEWLDATSEELYVESYNSDTLCYEKKQIIRLYREKINGYLRSITLEDNYNIICSINHIFFHNLYKWTNKLNINDIIYTLDGMKKIINIKHIQYNGYIYDLEVDSTHSYIANKIICHNTCAAIAIAENFKDQVKKYGTKIHILVPGQLIKESWKDDIIKCTKETYLKDVSLNIGYMNKNEQSKQMKQAKLLSQQYYKIMSYRSFYKKVLGQKISDNKFLQVENKIKKSYRKNVEGEYERDIPIDRIDILDNTLLIIDEAHNITDNEYGNAVKKIIEKSTNLKIILLSATPMINFADEIIQLLNFIRPIDDQIRRDNVFTSDRTHTMSLKSNGIEYLKNMANGYVSHYRGGNPYTYAESIDIGEIPKELIYTKLFRCKMMDFQQKTYIKVVQEQDDSLDRKSQSVSNFCFPGLSNDKKSIIGYKGKEGLNIVRNQLKTNLILLQKTINDTFFEGKLNNNEIINDLDQNKSITGMIFKKENIKFFSTKFYNALENLDEVVEGKKGAGTVFIYFNLVKIGIELFTEVLNINGYLEYNENGNYIINNNTKDAITGLSYEEFIQNKINRQFFPATYITLTGQTEDTKFVQADLKKKILDSVFNIVSNKDGRFIKLVLGSKVMNEGITLENVSEVHIMDVYFNLGKIHQVIGRYVVSLDNVLSTEELMYQKAEKKYILIKEIERSLKEISFDCPLNYHGNIFPEEIQKYENCTIIDKYIDMTPQERNNTILCPQQCDFTKCIYKCFDNKLNLKYYNKNKNIYNKISKHRLDFSTFTNILAFNEINYAKNIIKKLFKFKYVCTLDECINIIRNSYKGEKKKLFEDFFVFKALDELIPINENDFNNFSDTIYDKFNIPGYLIYREKFYIFQPFDLNEDVPMYYRSNFYSNLFNDISLYSYLKSSNILNIINSVELTKKDIKKHIYDFKNVINYYDNKPDYDYVGIVDLSSIKKRSLNEVIPDVFKLRSKKMKISSKRRGVGIPSLKGAVCESSTNKFELLKILKKIKVYTSKYFNIEHNEILTSRTSICLSIRYFLLFLEKYSLNKDNNKLTYFIIPTNHSTHRFPYNLEDHVDFLIDYLKNTININFTYNINIQSNGIFEYIRDISYPKYIINIPNSTELSDHMNLLKSLNFILDKNIWTLIIE